MSHTWGYLYTRDVEYHQVRPVTNTGDSASGLQHEHTKLASLKFPCGVRVESEVEKSWPFKTMHVTENTIISFQFRVINAEQHEVLTHGVHYKKEQKDDITSLIV